MKDRTKKRFAYELASMLEEMPLEKIKVQDLCMRCEERRQVFYYHFQDKYALVAWIYDQEYRAAVRESRGGDYRELVTCMLNRLWSHRSFYKKAFADRSQNSIEWHIHQANVERSEEVLKRHLGIKEISGEQRYAIIYHSFGCVSTTAEWLRGNLDATPLEFAQRQCQCMPGFLKQAHEADALHPLVDV